MTKAQIATWILTLATGLLPGFSRAAADEMPVQAHGKTRAESAQHGEAREPEAEGEHTHGGRPHHRNELALLLGATDESGHDAELTLGLEYSRAVADRWAVGGLVDYAGGELRNLVVGVPVFWRPGGGWKLFAAPGVEIHQGRDGESLVSVRSGEPGGADEDETHFLVRFGAAYVFHLGERYGVEPSVAIDLVDGEDVWVAGLNWTVGW